MNIWKIHRFFKLWHKSFKIWTKYYSIFVLVKFSDLQGALFFLLHIKENIDVLLLEILRFLPHFVINTVSMIIHLDREVHDGIVVYISCRYA